MTTTVQLPREVLDAYRDQGFARLGGMFSPDEIAAFRKEADRIDALGDLFAEPGRGMIRKGVDRDDRIDPVIDVSPVFSALAFDDRIMSLASEALGGEAQLLKDKYIVKRPGGPGYGVHQDLAYWHELCLSGDLAMTIALCIDRCTVENGALEFAPGFHRELLTEPGVVADPDEALFSGFDTVIAEPGDMLLFSALSPHRSEPNRSSDTRRILFLTYIRDERPDMYGFYQQVRKSF